MKSEPQAFGEAGSIRENRFTFRDDSLSFVETLPSRSLGMR